MVFCSVNLFLHVGWIAFFVGAWLVTILIDTLHQFCPGSTSILNLNACNANLYGVAALVAFLVSLASFMYYMRLLNVVENAPGGAQAVGGADFLFPCGGYPVLPLPHVDRRRGLWALFIFLVLVASAVAAIPSASGEVFTPDEDVCDKWKHAVRHLIDEKQQVEREKRLEMWLRRSYVVTNQSADELLNFEDCMTPMDRLNLKISHQQIMEIFQAAGITRTLSGLYALDMKDIHRFYALLSERPALKDIFRQYPSVLHNFWTVNDLENFLFIEQEARDDKCDPGPSLVETCEWMIQTFDPIQEHRAHKLLSLGGKYYRMDNTAESNKRTRVSNTRDDFVRHCAQHLVRIYPAGIRTDSCSMNPFPGMDAGCQIVAVNYQDKSKETQIYRAFFGNNGGCGYILKPEHMRNITSEPGESRRIQLTVRVISAQQLPKVPVAGEKEISDPFVFVEIYGCPEDCEVMSTTPAKNNGCHHVYRLGPDERQLNLSTLYAHIKCV